jgi:Sec-independent protein translocase protein TatA
MDGIFGVGLAEMVIIVLVILIIGGPQNAIKWSRDLGRLIRQAREMWAKLVKDLEKEIGPEAKELVNTTRELTQNVNEIRQAANPHSIAQKANRMVQNAIKEADPLSGPPPSADQAPDGTSTPPSSPFSDWLPKDK